MNYLKILILVWFTFLVAEAGTEAQAEAVLVEYDTKFKAWEGELARAASMQQMQAAYAKKPNTAEYRDRMIKIVGAELKNAWTLKYAGWLIANTPVGKKDTAFIMQYAERFHMGAPNLGDFCYDVAVSNQPVQVKKVFIEKALDTIKDKKQKGVAAVSLAIVLTEIGDNARNNARRLTLMRQAIIDSAEVKVGNSTVGETAMEMVYRLKNLSKGRLAPAINGVDSAGRPVSLANYKGKVVMLVFWSSFDLDVEQTVKLLDLMRQTEKDYLGKNFVLIGVNKDQLGNLRELEKEKQTSAINISDPQQKIFGDYRVGVSPYCFIIDKQGRIAYTGAVGSFATLTADALLNARPAAPALKR